MVNRSPRWPSISPRFRQPTDKRGPHTCKNLYVIAFIFTLRGIKHTIFV
uniref:Uncharacterized protein n=1 Tax=uncultured alpha proteobacterium HF0010_13E22 TaxID=710801 RepID=E0XQZ1_9PROT|nr:hypothetical protein [uncultured alpha proteobacterium HF0010_13E22]